jgi:hypothetical protein
MGNSNKKPANRKHYPTDKEREAELKRKIANLEQVVKDYQPYKFDTPEVFRRKQQNHQNNIKRLKSLQIDLKRLTDNMQTKQLQQVIQQQVSQQQESSPQVILDVDFGRRRRRSSFGRKRRSSSKKRSEFGRKRRSSKKRSSFGRKRRSSKRRVLKNN